MGAAAATVESVRLDPELRQALAERARRDRETTSHLLPSAGARLSPGVRELIADLEAHMQAVASPFDRSR
jgi:hypothetical protein